MPAPRVFVSSTYYDLSSIRADVERMLREMGYVPILSESGSVTFEPRGHVAAAAVQEVANCDMLVLLIGGRRGSSMPEGDASVTNAEYERAVEAGVPVFALVLDDVLLDLRTYEQNVSNPDADAEKIRYGSVDSTSVFRFVNEVRSAAVNNALQPFHNFFDIERYLKAQWAGLLQAYMRQQASEHQVADTLTELRGMSQKIEALTELILKAVNPTEAPNLDERLARIDQNRALASWFVRRGVRDLKKVTEFQEPLLLLASFGVEPDEDISRTLVSPEFVSDYAALRQLPPADLELLQKMVAPRPAVMSRPSRASVTDFEIGDRVRVLTAGNPPRTGRVVGIATMVDDSRRLVVGFDDGPEEFVDPGIVRKELRGPVARPTATRPQAPAQA